MCHIAALFRYCLCVEFLSDAAGPATRLGIYRNRYRLQHHYILTRHVRGLGRRCPAATRSAKAGDHGQFDVFLWLSSCRSGRPLNRSGSAGAIRRDPDRCQLAVQRCRPAVLGAIVGPDRPGPGVPLPARQPDGRFRYSDDREQSVDFLGSGLLCAAVFRRRRASSVRFMSAISRISTLIARPFTVSS